MVALFHYSSKMLYLLEQSHLLFLGLCKLALTHLNRPNRCASEEGSELGIALRQRRAARWVSSTNSGEGAPKGRCAIFNTAAHDRRAI